MLALSLLVVLCTHVPAAALEADRSQDTAGASSSRGPPPAPAGGELEGGDTGTATGTARLSVSLYLGTVLLMVSRVRLHAPVCATLKLNAVSPLRSPRWSVLHGF